MLVQIHTIFCMLVQAKRMLKILGVSMVKNGGGQSCDGTLKLTLSEEWTNGINWFFAYWCRFITVKSWSNGHCQNWVWPVWSWDSKIYCISKLNRWNNLIFLHANTNAGRLKVDSIIFECSCQRWQWLLSNWDPTTCILKMSIWIELIILMLIVMQ